MIYNEKELYELRRNKKVIYPIKKPENKKEAQGDNSFLIAALNGIFTVIVDIKESLKSHFDAMESKIDSIVKNNEPPPQPEKKSDEWDFKIVRDLDNRIQKIEATRRK